MTWLPESLFTILMAMATTGCGVSMLVKPNLLKTLFARQYAVTVKDTKVLSSDTFATYLLLLTSLHYCIISVLFISKMYLYDEIRQRARGYPTSPAPNKEC